MSSWSDGIPIVFRRPEFATQKLLAGKLDERDTGQWWAAAGPSRRAGSEGPEASLNAQRIIFLFSSSQSSKLRMTIMRGREGKRTLMEYLP